MLNVSRTEGETRLIGCKMCVEAKVRNLEWQIKCHIEGLIVVRKSNTAPSENSTHSKKFKKEDNEERLNNWKGKAMHGKYLRQVEDKDEINTWKWFRKSN